MAFLLQDLVIINDNRELIGVNTAGITTALYVGETIQLDAQSGVVTATKFVGSGASLTDLPPGSFISSEAPATREDGSPLQEGDIYYDSSVLRQFTRYDNDGAPIWVDSNPAASAAVLSVNVGVDTALIDLTTGKLIIEGTDDEVTVGINTVTDTVTIGLPDDVSIAGTMTAAFYEGDGSKLTNISGGSVDLTGTYQDLGGVNISGPGVALTVTNNATIGGDLTVDGITTLNGAISLGDSSLDFLSVAGTFVSDLIPAINNSVDLGTSAEAWKDLYIAGKVSVGGSITAGSYYGDGSNLTGIGIGPDSDIITTGNIQAGIITATTSLEATGAGVGLTVTNNMYAGGSIEAAGSIITPAFGFAGNLFLGVFFDDDDPAVVNNTELVSAAGAKTIAESVVGSGSTQVFASLELTGPGIALTVTNNVSVGGSITAGSYYGDGSNLTGLQAGAATSVTSFDNQDNVSYPVPFLSGVGVGATIYTDSTANEELTYNPSTGTLESKEFNALSDQRLKTNITGITSALHKLEQLRGVEYDWVNGSGSSVGVIAQEVQSVYPQLVADSENRMTVNYNGLVGLLIQAVNELSVLLDDYKSK